MTAVDLRLSFVRSKYLVSVWVYVVIEFLKLMVNLRPSIRLPPDILLMILVGLSKTVLFLQFFLFLLKVRVQEVGRKGIKWTS